VHPTGHELLARAVFARDEHPRIARRHLVDKLPHPLDLSGRTDDGLGMESGTAATPDDGRLRGGRGYRSGIGLVGRIDHLMNRGKQPIHVDGLGQVIACTVAHGSHRRIDGTLARQDDERNPRIGNPAGRIGQNEVERYLFAQPRGYARILRRFGREALVLQSLAQDVSHTF